MAVNGSEEKPSTCAQPGTDLRRSEALGLEKKFAQWCLISKDLDSLHLCLKIGVSMRIQKLTEGRRLKYAQTREMTSCNRFILPTSCKFLEHLFVAAIP
jgi:hypothetical protein